MATREIYWNIVGSALIYGFAGVALALLLRGTWRRARLWRLGGAETRTDRIGRRLAGSLVEVFGQRRSLRDPIAGIAHLLIFYGFSAELVATGLIALQEWSGIHFLQGTFYRWFSLSSDVFGLLGLAGVSMALWRRSVVRPAHLHSVLDDWVALALLFAVFAQGFVVEGARIAATELHAQPELARWSPGGAAVALALQHLSADALLTFHRVNWWVHAFTAFGFIGYVAYGKLDHIGYGLVNVFARNLRPSGKLSHPDIEAELELDPDREPTLGVARIDGFTWKVLLDLDACMNCGRCEAVCPAYGSGVPLNPRKLIQDMKRHLSEVGSRLLQPKEATASDDLPPLFGSSSPDATTPAVLEEELWGCRTCGACQEECPVFVEHVPKIVDMRRHLVMNESRMGEATRQLLKNIDERTHPWVGEAGDREAWFADLDIKVLGRGERAEWLFWVGCTGAMVERNVRVTRALAKILSAAGLDFAVLGAEEVCTGDPARRSGGELTFQVCAKQNIETLRGYGVRKIVTTCPHCFNTLKNEYPDFGGEFEVVHHSQLIRDLLQGKRLRLRRELDSLTYHDPCYLGRHNGVYDAPREVLSALAKPGALRELPRNRSRSLCCGAGGGYAWMDDGAERRISHTRLEEVRACGSQTAAVSCPFCMQMFEDASNTVDPERSVRAADIAELVAEALVE